MAQFRETSKWENFVIYLCAFGHRYTVNCVNIPNQQHDTNLQIRTFWYEKRKNNGCCFLFYQVFRCSIPFTSWQSKPILSLFGFGNKGPNCMCQMMFNFPCNIFFNGNTFYQNRRWNGQREKGGKSMTEKPFRICIQCLIFVVNIWKQCEIQTSEPHSKYQYLNIYWKSWFYDLWREI